MQNLYNELTSGTTETNAKGEMVTKPPTSLMLRAARTLKQLADINDNNMVNINGMQQALQHDSNIHVELSGKINELSKEIEQLKVQQKDLYTQLLEKDENLRNDTRQQQSESEEAVNVGSAGPNDRASDQGSEGGVQFDDCGLGSN